MSKSKTKKPNNSAADKKFMQRALALAASQYGTTSPDPMVGAVIVKGGKIIAEGYHGAFTTPHAESWAIEKAGKAARGATLYVTLEPCCHFGNNPPCAAKIIRSGIKKVVAAQQDPNPLVNGKGFKMLKKAKIKVRTGVLENEAKKLNEFFIKHITTNLPFIVLKAAASLDGKIATESGDSRWISSEDSRKFTHKLRNQVDAVLVGINTVLKDNCRLTVRLAKKFKNPVRIVLDHDCRIPGNAKVLNPSDAPTIIVTSPRAPKSKIAFLERKGVEVLLVKSQKGKINLKELFAILGKRKIMSILIEGGSAVFTSALEAKLVDKIILCLAPKLIGGQRSKTWFAGRGIKKISRSLRLKNVTFKAVGDDIMVEGYL